MSNRTDQKVEEQKLEGEDPSKKIRINPKNDDD